MAQNQVKYSTVKNTSLLLEVKCHIIPFLLQQFIGSFQGFVYSFILNANS